MRLRCLSMVCLGLVACGPELLETEAPPTEAPERQTTQQVGVGFEHGEALFTVTRTDTATEAPFTSFDQALPMPEGAVASDLEVLVDGQWRPADFLDAQVAAETWGDLTGPGEAAPRPLVLLERGEFSAVSLRAFGLAPGSTLTVRYRLRAPASYEAGELSTEYPDPEGASFELPLGTRAEPIVDPDSAVTTSTRLVTPAAAIADADARWAVAALGEDRALWRLELDVAARLGAVPARPTVVFAVDASHSEGAAGIAAQLELLPGYLAAVPDAEVEVVLYRRHAERLFGRFVSAAEVDGLLRAVSPARLAPGNGSNLDEACALAAQLLSSRAGVTRLVVMNDAQRRNGLTPEVALASMAALPADTVVHLVQRAEQAVDGLSEQRDDDDPLAPAVAAHGGMVLDVWGHAKDSGELERTLLGLVRPVRLDDLTVEAEGLELEVPGLLAEGQTLRQTAFAPAPPATVTVRGKVWAREVVRVLTVDPGLHERLPAIALGSSELGPQLTEQEERAAALAARAVSHQTSYLWAPAEAQPSVAGSLSGFGCSGGCDMGTSGTSSICGGFTTFGRPDPDYDHLLGALLEPAHQRCAALGDGSPSTLTLEATGDEVVDVTATGGTSEQRACLTEAAWLIRLGPDFKDHKSYQLTR